MFSPGWGGGGDTALGPQLQNQLPWASEASLGPTCPFLLKLCIPFCSGFMLAFSCPGVGDSCYFQTRQRYTDQDPNGSMLEVSKPC